MKATIAELLNKIPGKASAEWPMGEPFALAFAHGSMSVEIYTPKATDIQTPHDQDELYLFTLVKVNWLLPERGIRLHREWCFLLRHMLSIGLKTFQMISSHG